MYNIITIHHSLRGTDDVINATQNNYVDLLILFKYVILNLLIIFVFHKYKLIYKYNQT